MGLAIAEPFNYPVDLTAYPEYMMDVEYPMDLSLIKARVENEFYRRVAAIQRDVRYIYTERFLLFYFELEGNPGKIAPCGHPPSSSHWYQTSVYH